MPSRPVAWAPLLRLLPLRPGGPPRPPSWTGRVGSWLRALLFDMFPFTEGILWSYVKQLKIFTF